MKRVVLIPLAAIALLLSACAPAPTPSPTYVKPTALPATELPSPTEPPTDTPTPEPTSTETPTPQPTATLLGPVYGTFDVYFSAPADDEGRQLIRWLDVGSGAVVGEVLDFISEGTVHRGGEAVYYVNGDDIPIRMNSRGETERLTFAAPPVAYEYYEFLPAANGHWLAWVTGSLSEGSFIISISSRDGLDAHILYHGQSVPGARVHLLRVTNDGKSIFYDLIGPDVREPGVFGGASEVHQLSTESALDTLLPGEPACENRFCPAHISPDGAYFARGLPVFDVSQPLVITNLVSGNVLTRFAIPRELLGRVLTVGYPVFTPGGELVYEVELGPLGGESYMLVFANIVTGEQRVLADLRTTPHVPLGWSADATSLLTARRGLFDTWQTPLDGSRAPVQIAGMRFLATITVDTLPD